MINLKRIKKGFFPCLALIIVGILISLNTFAVQASGDEEIVANGTIGDGGAPWRLYEDGLLVVDEGFINWTGTESPWNDHRLNIYEIEFTGSIDAGTSLARLFSNLENVITIEGLEYFDTSQVTDMSMMFGRVRSLIDLDVSNWDTTQVSNMRAMFNQASSLIVLDVSGWDTSQVNDMNGIFSGTSSLTELDVSSWDTSQVTEMIGVFSGARSLRDLDVSGWDTSQVIDMRQMFLGVSLTELDLSSWNTSQVSNMGSMFNGASSLRDLDVSGWDTGQVASMRYMFNGASSLTELDLSGWDTTQVTDMVWMFRGASSLTKLDLSSWNIGNETRIGNMFIEATSLRQITLGFEIPRTGLPAINPTDGFTGYWQNVGDGTIDNPLGEHELTSEQLMNLLPMVADTFVWQPVRGDDACVVIAEGQFADQDGESGITGAPWRFCDDGVLIVDEGFLDQSWRWLGTPWHNYRMDIYKIEFTGPITAGRYLSNLFSRLSNVATIEGLEYFDTSQVTDMSHMFYNVSSLTTLDVSSWNTSQVIGMRGMFSSANNLVTLNVSGWDTSQVTDMGWLFARTSVTVLDLSGWNTGQVTDMGMMFGEIDTLRQLTLGENFAFVDNHSEGNSRLPSVSLNHQFTGYWQNVGDGTVDNPMGEHVLTSDELMSTFDGSTMADTFVWQPVRESIPTYEITHLSIGGVTGYIDQTAQTITFAVDEDDIDSYNQFRGNITEIEAISETLIFHAGGQDWPMGVGASAGVSTGVTVRAESGDVIYTIIIEHPDVPVGTIDALSIGGIPGLIDPDAQEIIFIVDEDEIDTYGQFRGYITELEASSDTVIFHASGQDWPLRLGESAGISTGNTVRVEGGIIYTINIVHSDITWVSTPEELAAIAGPESAGRTFALANDIHLTEAWTPIEGFLGTLDGRGHAIHNLFVSEESGMQTAGLFGIVGEQDHSSEVVIKNLGIYLSSHGLNANSTNELSVGGLVGRVQYGSLDIINSYVSGDIFTSNTPDIAGGLVGSVNGSINILDSFAENNVISTDIAGGLIGRIYYNSSASITNSYAAGDVTASGEFSQAGGLIGQANGSVSITSSYRASTQNVSGSYINSLGEERGPEQMCPPYLPDWDFENIWDFCKFTCGDSEINLYAFGFFPWLQLLR